jgi:translation initiation factor 1A
MLTSRKQGGKNRRRGKNESDKEKRELTFKEEGQGTSHFLQVPNQHGPEQGV